MNQQKQIEHIHKKIMEFAELKKGKKGDELKDIGKALEVLKERARLCKQTLEETAHRTEDILQAIMALAQLDYSARASVSSQGTDFDAISAGINMLGEELESSTVSLKEKEILLKEVHHRVKNNLQVVSSLLSLQSSFIENEFYQAKMNECRDRIRSMALIHEKLYQTRNLNELEFGSYMEELAMNLNSGHNTDSSRIRLEFVNKAKEVNLKIDTAVPCGLIINEVLMNAFKYAFPGKRKGTITVKLEKIKDKNGNDIAFSISDDGIGMKEEKYNSTNTLGLQLVDILIQQLKGNVEIRNGKGVSFRFSINSRYVPLA